ncbi:MAG TPA: hypothetical protein VKN99_15770 [Polyangia bacterium]|nr:hypothetical protein [Polyangia bacterium]
MKRIALLVMAIALALAAVTLLWQERRARTAPAGAQTAAGAQVAPAAPTAQAPAPSPTPAAPPIAPPAAQTPVRKLLGPSGPIPAGSAIATPPGQEPRTPDGEEIIRPAPPDQRTVRDHRGEPTVAPKRSFSSKGIDAAMAALRPAVAPCAPASSRVTLTFTLVSSGGSAQARDVHIVGAQLDAQAQTCVDKALAALSWPTPDGDGSDLVTMPLVLR